eukprot:2777296-Pleurochrysis_carterae.AAC.2
MQLITCPYLFSFPSNSKACLGNETEIAALLSSKSAQLSIYGPPNPPNFLPPKSFASLSIYPPIFFVDQTITRNLMFHMFTYGATHPLYCPASKSALHLLIKHNFVLLFSDPAPFITVAAQRCPVRGSSIGGGGVCSGDNDGGGGGGGGGGGFGGGGGGGGGGGSGIYPAEQYYVADWRQRLSQLARVHRVPRSGDNVRHSGDNVRHSGDNVRHSGDNDARGSRDDASERKSIGIERQGFGHATVPE